MLRGFSKLSDPSTEELTLTDQNIADLSSVQDKLASMPMLTALDLSGNHLSKLPADMSNMRKLKKLNLCRNNISVVEDLIPALKTLPQLSELHVDISTDAAEEALLVALPDLICLNGHDIAGVGGRQALNTFPEPRSSMLEGSVEIEEKDAFDAPDEVGQGSEQDAKPKLPEVSLTKQDLESLAALFNTVKNLGGSQDAERERKMTQTFETHLQTVVKRLNDRLKTMKETAQRHAEILLAKHGLYDLCFQEIISHSGSVNPQLQDSMRTICNVHSDLFQLLEGVLSATVAENVELQQDLERSEADSAQYLHSATVLEKEAEDHQMEIVELRKQISKLQARNRQLESQPSQYRGNDTNGKSGAPSSAKKSGGGGKVGNGMSPAGKKGGATDRPGSSQKSGQAVIGEIIITDNVPGGQWTDGAKSSYTVRMLSLKQLKDYIAQIYDSKEKYDAKCRTQSLARETMEQHMFSYMNQRFGLKQLIIENIASLLRAVGNYAEKDNDVAVFQKIVSNDIDEEFRRVQQQIKDTVSDLLRIHLKGKNRLKSDEVVGGLLQNKMTGYLGEEEWTNIIKYMYNAEDSEMLTRITLDFIDKNARDPANPDISYADLTHILLDFQLRGHDRFLLRFRELFQKFDTDKDGVLSTAEFSALVARVNPSRDAGDTATLLKTADPSASGRITYSDAVASLSPDIVDMMITVARTVGTTGNQGGSFVETFKSSGQ